MSQAQRASEIEKTLVACGSPATAVGIVVGQSQVEYKLVPDVGTCLSHVQALTEEIATALDVPQVMVMRSGRFIQIEAPRPRQQGV